VHCGKCILSCVLHGVGDWSVVLLVILQFMKGARKSVCLTMNTILKKVLLSVRGNSEVRPFVWRRSVKLHIIEIVMGAVGRLQILRLK
jgi:hypothetical protein